MKIGIFTEVYKPVINGVVNSMINFKQGLEKLGHEVYIFCPNYKGTRPGKNVIYCQSLALPEKIGYHYIYPFDSKINKLAQTLDIIHVQHPFIMGERAARVARKYQIPIVFTNHTQYDQYTHYIPFLSKRFVSQQVNDYIKRFSNKVDLIIAPAAGIKRKLRRKKITTPIEIVPNGININKFKKTVSQQKINSIKKKFNIPINNKVLIFTGRIAQEKNIDFLIKTFRRLVKSKPRINLLLVGGGIEIEKYQKMIMNFNLSHKVKITDFVTYDKISDYLACADIYVTASKTEVHPLTILEGMAAGLPMIIVKASGTGDIVRNNYNGLVSKEDCDSFNKNIITLLEDEKIYHEISDNAKITAENYSITNTSKKLEKIYLGLVDKNK